MAQPLFNQETPKDTVFLVLVGKDATNANWADKVTGESGLTRFDPKVLRGRNAMIKELPKHVADTITSAKGVFIREVPSELGWDLVKHMEEGAPLERAWKRVMGEDLVAPTARYDEQRERVGLLRQAEQLRIAVDKKWDNEQLRRYVNEPALIYKDRFKLDRDGAIEDEQATTRQRSMAAETSRLIDELTERGALIGGTPNLVELRTLKKKMDERDAAKAAGPTPVTDVWAPDAGPEDGAEPAVDAEVE